ncbi:MAG TPA: peptidoglycan-associated lipoprotein [Elusimicrobia bacterium]|nr:peptidoglycan-associated lipoprotein [Elusimicrobiota bacterium]
MFSQMMISSTRFLRLALPLGLALAVAGACAPKKTVKKPGTGLNAAGLASDADDSLSSSIPSVDVEEARIRGKEFRQTQELKTVYFDYDSYALNDAARETLKDDAGYLKTHIDLEILIEGHCDQRGTNEYNLALGQKRAKETRDYLIRSGIPGKSVGTISFGKERLACEDMTEECWGQNRRADIKIRARTASSKP